jgi:DNA-binding MarR family transcriptional regulator
MARASQKSGQTGKGPPEVLKLTRRMTTLFRERLEEQLKPLGITAAQLQLLAALIKEPGTSGAHISRFCQVTPQTTHALLATAEGRGWVRRAPHPENAHTLLATLTPQGRRVFARGKTIVIRLQGQMLRTLTAAEVGHLETTLVRLIENLELRNRSGSRRV